MAVGGKADGAPPPALTEQMRAATRDVHATSDRLVNAKLGLVLTSPRLYGEALALFHPIYAKIEEILERHRNHTQIGKVHPLLDLLTRTPGFEADVKFYLTSDRREELERMVADGDIPEIAEYLQHLEEISKDDPILVLAYVYHSYAGILAGGQIIKGLVRKALGLSKQSNEGVQCFAICDEKTAPKVVMARMKKILNEEIVLTTDEQERIVREGGLVFRQNNLLINAICTTSAWKEASNACRKRILVSLIGIAAFVVGYALFFTRYDFGNANELGRREPRISPTLFAQM